MDFVRVKSMDFFYKNRFLYIGQNSIFVKNLLLIFLVLMFMYSQPNVGGSGLLMPNNTALWTLVGLFSVVTFYKAIIVKGHWFVSSSANWFIIVLTSIFILTLVNTTSSEDVQFLYAVGFFGVILFFYTLFQWRLSHAKFLQILVFVCLIGLLHAIISIIQLHDSYHVWYYFTEYLPFNLSGKRPLGVVQQVNMNATFMATIITVSLYLITHKSFKFHNVFYQSIVYLSILTSVYVLTLSFSRAGILAAVIGLFIILVVRRKCIIKNKYFWFWLSNVFSGLVLAYFLPGMALNNGFLDSKLEAIASGTDIRLFLYSSAIKMFLQSPVFGYGLGGYTQGLLTYVNTLGISPGLDELDLKTFLHPHNEIFFWVLQGGISVLLLIILLVGLYIKALLKQRGMFVIGILGLATPMLLQAQLSSPFVFSSLHLLLPLFFLQYAVRNEKTKINFSFNRGVKMTMSILLVLLLVFVVYLAWFTLKSIEESHDYEYRLFLTAKQSKQEINNIRYFEHATYHPAFRQTVELVMNKMLLKSLTQNNKYDIKRFIWWAENQSQNTRSKQTQINLKKAYAFMKQDKDKGKEPLSKQS